MYSFHKRAECVLFRYLIILIFISRWQLSVTSSPRKRFYFRTVPIQHEGNVVQYKVPYTVLVRIHSIFRNKENSVVFCCFELCLQVLLVQTSKKSLSVFGCHIDKSVLTTAALLITVFISFQKYLFSSSCLK